MINGIERSKYLPLFCCGRERTIRGVVADQCAAERPKIDLSQRAKRKPRNYSRREAKDVVLEPSTLRRHQSPPGRRERSRTES